MKNLYNPFTGELFSDEAMKIKEKIMKLKTASTECLIEFDALYKKHEVIVFKAATGTGKGVVIAPHVMELENKKESHKVFVTEPRQTNCSSIAKYLGKIYGEKYVNYGFRFNNNLTETTMLNFVTDGTLVNYFYNDKTANIKTIIVDEVHERNKNIDQILAFCRIMKKKLVILSATIDIDFYVNYFKEVNISVGSMLLEAETTFKIKDIYLTKEEDYVAQAVKVVGEIINRNEPGDIIIFLASAPECIKACKKIRELKVKSVCYELHRGNRDDMEAKLDSADAFKNDLVDGMVPDRKIIFATNVAESGVTISGLKFVIDSGRRYESVFIGAEGLYELNSKFISKAESDQRRGRVGRVADGTNYRLFSEENFNNEFPDYKDPEILIEDITELTLNLLGSNYARENYLKIDELYNNMPNPPSADQRKFAVHRIKELELVNDNFKLTNLGVEVTKMNFGVDISIVAVMAASYKIQFKVSRMLAMFSIEPEVKKWFRVLHENDSRYKDYQAQIGKWKSSKGEIFVLFDIIEAYGSLPENERDAFCKKNYLDSKKLYNALKQTYKYSKLMHDAVPVYERPYNAKESDLIIDCFKAGFRDNIGVKKGDYYEIDRPIGRVKLDKPDFLKKLNKKIIFTEITKIAGKVVLSGIINI